MGEPDPLAALRDVVGILRHLHVPFALVGGLAISVRAEVRATRDVDLAFDFASDSQLMELSRELNYRGYLTDQILEPATGTRIMAMRMLSPDGTMIDLLAATCGIEPEVVHSATPVDAEGVGEVPIASAAHLLAMKVLSATDRRPRDRLDAINLLVFNPEIDVTLVARLLDLIAERGFDRGEPLRDKLDDFVRAADRAR